DAVGISSGSTPARGFLDQEVAVIGHGPGDFQSARVALTAWKHFNLGWVDVFPSDAPLRVGTNVAVLIRHLGFYSLNGCRVVEVHDGEHRFSFAYGTLTTHAESGEELFEVFIDPPSQDVFYRIRAVSWPRALLARVGQPLVRVLQARFR